MGTEVGRIEKEFVLKSLVDSSAACDVHGIRKEGRCTFAAVTETALELTAAEGDLSGFEVGEEVRVFFYLRNNYHTFVSRVTAVAATRLTVEQPPGIYKNLQRKYERVKITGDLEVSFTVKGKSVELNFPKSERYKAVEPPEVAPDFDAGRIQEVIKSFRERMSTRATENAIVMLRDRLPRLWEEKIIVRLGKSLWIPSTEEDFPSHDPYPDGRIITKQDLVRLEQEGGAQPHVANSRLANILYEKVKQQILSELWTPVLYNEYAVGYLRIWNTVSRRERISRELLDYQQEFAKVLCYSLATNGYFRAESSSERRYEAPIIDMSASGLLFAHTSNDLVRDLTVHTDLPLSIKLEGRVMRVGARIMRKFRDAENAYFGVLFLKIDPADFAALYQFLYGKPFDPASEGRWEGGAPPPPLVV